MNCAFAAFYVFHCPYSLQMSLGIAILGSGIFAREGEEVVKFADRDVY